MKIGDRVRVVGLPRDLPRDSDEGGLNTSALLRDCVGRVFPIIAFNEQGYAELHVGEVRRRKSRVDSIWIEPEFLVIVGSSD